MVKCTEENIVFCIADGKAPDDPTTLIIGIPKAAWEYMKQGKTNHFSLEKLGIPVQIILYGANSHEEALKWIQHSATQQGIPLLDERRTDFSIPTFNDDNQKP